MIHIHSRRGEVANPRSDPPVSWLPNRKGSDLVGKILHFVVNISANTTFA